MDNMFNEKEILEKTIFFCLELEEFDPEDSKSHFQGVNWGGKIPKRSLTNMERERSDFG
jgi:hypothetical protein